MFLWCSLLAPAPTTASLLAGMHEHSVCVLPGDFASVTKGATSTYVRLSYVLDEVQYDEGTRRFARLVAGLVKQAGEEAAEGTGCDTGGGEGVPRAAKVPRS